MKFFNTAGPANPEKHYYVPHRFNEQEIRQLIEQEKYFILHAPRQSGKTTGLLQLVKMFNSEGNYKALYVNVEPAQSARSNIVLAMGIIITQFKKSILDTFGATDPGYTFLETFQPAAHLSGAAMGEFLHHWCGNSNKPIVVFIDEIDSLVGDTLIAVLRQIRAGYTDRPGRFPQSICLVGVRDVRDYRIHSDELGTMVLGGSAFNIKAKSLTLPSFTPEQVRDLYNQHTVETGQQFTPEAVNYAFKQTEGQPWLVNALAYEACFEMVTDRTKPITKEIFEQAREIIIKRRDTHIDVLIDRLSEPRIRRVIEPIIMGDTIIENLPIDDIQYAIDLGLVVRREKTLDIANPIYREVFPRELTSSTQDYLTQKTAWFVNPDGSLDVKKLLISFTDFFRENADFWLERFDYKEAGPHLLLMAFLQRVINGGGSINREYALGMRRVDLLIVWKKQRIVVELKILRGPKTVSEGLEQTAAYMDMSHATEGHLVIFDRRPGRTWDEKIYQKEEVVNNKTITVWGL